jgi:hypothetical protein
MNNKKNNVTSFLDIDNIKEIFRQLYDYSEISFFKFDRACEFLGKDINGNDTILFLAGFDIDENYNKKFDEDKVLLNVVFLQEDPEEIKEYELKKKELDNLIVSTNENKDNIPNFEEVMRDLKKQYRILHRMTENDQDPEEVLNRPPMSLVLHSKQKVELNINRLVLIDVGKVLNPTFFELQVTKELLKMRFVQRTRSLEGLFLEDIYKKSRFF